MAEFKENRKVLYVDDEPNLLYSFRSLMRRENIETVVLDCSPNIAETLEREGPFAVVVSDQRMPEWDGVRVLQYVGEKYPATIRILMTGFADHNDTLRAINEGGISRYVSKPWDDEELRSVVRSSIENYNLATQNKFLLEELKRSNASLNELLNGTVSATVRLLSDMCGYVSPQAVDQMERIRNAGLNVLSLLPNLDATERWEITRAYDLFNLGLALLPPWVQAAISKNGLESLDRITVARNHHILAADLLEQIPRFEGVARIIRFMKKDFNGSGEPISELVGGYNIPNGARILHVLLDRDRLNTDNFKGDDVLEHMAKLPAKYDVGLILKMLGHFVATPKSAAERILKLKVDALNSGMVVLQDIKTQKGLHLLSSNSLVTETALKILMMWHKTDPVVEPILVRLPQ